MGLTVDSSQLTFVPTSKSRDTKNWAKFRQCPSSRIRGQLTAPIVNGDGDSFWKWPDFQLWSACDLDLGLGHTAYSCASVINLYLYAKFHWTL